MSPSGKERQDPDECGVGDWMRASSVPDWPIHERLHAHAPAAIRQPPAPSLAPTTHPALAVLFEQGSLREDGKEAVIWIRKE
jgi:hypothetical protein